MQAKDSSPLYCLNRYPTVIQTANSECARVQHSLSLLNSVVKPGCSGTINSRCVCLQNKRAKARG